MARGYWKPYCCWAEGVAEAAAAAAAMGVGIKGGAEAAHWEAAAAAALPIGAAASYLRRGRVRPQERRRAPPQWGPTASPSLGRQHPQEAPTSCYLFLDAGDRPQSPQAYFPGTDLDGRKEQGLGRTLEPDREDTPPPAQEQF